MLHVACMRVSQAVYLPSRGVYVQVVHNRRVFQVGPRFHGCLPLVHSANAMIDFTENGAHAFWG